MNTIRSGTTTERIVRTAILASVFVLYSAWSFRDGYYNWPLNDNLPKMLQNLAVPQPASPDLIKSSVTKAALDSVPDGASPAEVDAILGEPVAREQNTTFYFGPGGAAKITFRREKVARTEWIDQHLRTEVDLLVQKIIGIVTGIVGLLLLLQLLRALITRVELSDAGLRVNSQGGMRFGGSPLVPLEDMVGLKTEDYDRKGWVEVEYKLSDGREGTVSLNDYVHKAFPEIMAALCAHHGWEDPYRKRQLAKAAAAAQAEQATATPENEPDDKQG